MSELILIFDFLLFIFTQATPGYLKGHPPMAETGATEHMRHDAPVSGQLARKHMPASSPPILFHVIVFVSDKPIQ